MDLHYGRPVQMQNEMHNYVSCAFRTMQKSPFRIVFRIVRDPADRYVDSNREITWLNNGCQMDLMAFEPNENMKCVLNAWFVQSQQWLSINSFKRPKED